MSVTRQSDPDAFLAAAEPLLARNPAVRSFASAFADNWRHDPADFMRGTYVATYARGSALGFAVRRAGGPLILENSTVAAARAFADDMATHPVDLPAVTGEAAPCKAFAARWDARFGTSHREALHMRHHMLTELAPMPQAQGGAYRIADERDLQWLEAGALAFSHEVGLVESPANVIDGMRKRFERKRLRLWEDDGTRVAFAGWSTAGAEYARIAPVYTEPFARGRRYASALVATLVQELLADGRRAIFLLTDMANPISNAIYARIGFRAVSDTYRYDFVPVEASGA